MTDEILTELSIINGRLEFIETYLKMLSNFGVVMKNINDSLERIATIYEAISGGIEDE